MISILRKVVLLHLTKKRNYVTIENIGILDIISLAHSIIDRFEYNIYEFNIKKTQICHVIK